MSYITKFLFVITMTLMVGTMALAKQVIDPGKYNYCAINYTDGKRTDNSKVNLLNKETITVGLVWDAYYNLGDPKSACNEKNENINAIASKCLNSVLLLKDYSQSLTHEAKNSGSLVDDCMEGYNHWAKQRNEFLDTMSTVIDTRLSQACAAVPAATMDIIPGETQGAVCACRNKYMYSSHDKKAYDSFLKVAPKDGNLTYQYLMSNIHDMAPKTYELGNKCCMVMNDGKDCKATQPLFVH